MTLWYLLLELYSKGHKIKNIFQTGQPPDFLINKKNPEQDATGLCWVNIIRYVEICHKLHLNRVYILIPTPGGTIASESIRTP